MSITTKDLFNENNIEEALANLQFGTMIKEIRNSKDIDGLRLIEARYRQLYYSMFNEIIDDPRFKFTKRTRRPPRDPINAMISFGNTFLYNHIATEIYKSALDIRIGIIHATNSRNQTLNLDLADIFKPLIVDRAIFTLINKRMIDYEGSFVEREDGSVYLSQEGKRLFLQYLDNKMMQTIMENNKPISYNDRIRDEIRKIKEMIMSGGKYRPYKYY